ncbi:AAA family ATPase [Stenotrophomonas maltophilia]|uniref:AAA family ATPase n=1 Tax=Stenotrophomonas maltophilia TaxID=40324 RepID=UPI001969B8B7|nr:ATP-binding protein [Stenotrophomonas maltophilia]MBN4978694.1 ATP-binding protein [Stenotrophomonas maltophilia]MDG9939244.1 ATP-binding protein [Stenotrophomonas maltophilia]MDH0559185.1 ATP-binding protein [Stenotrophomonas maltophilia]
MQRIFEIYHNDEVVRLVDQRAVDAWDNTFTVIVGENGVGKSRLLSEIARSRVSDLQRLFGSGRFSNSTQPMVIAASTSPFDKFPAPPRRPAKAQKNYRYVGMRGEGIYGASSAVSLLSSAARGLLSKLAEAPPSLNLLGVLDSLSFFPVFHFVLKPQFQRSKADSQSDRSSHKGMRTSFRQGAYIYTIDDRLAAIIDSTDSLPGVLQDLAIASDFMDSPGALRLTVDFSNNIASIGRTPVRSKDLAAILRLFDENLVRLMDVEVEKYGHGVFSLKRASSGEQCLLVLMLGVAGHIQDHSLILIDEPEISLHPEWQERFIELLQSAFSRYKGCQFVIATHSPQIIARLTGNGSFIWHLRKRKLYPASQFEGRSADYQLAELFDAPGMMNEYVSRLCFNIIAQVRAGRPITNELKHEIDWLFKARAKMDSTDKLRALIDSVGELVRQGQS